MRGSAIEFFADNEDLKVLLNVFDDLFFDEIYTENLSKLNEDNIQFDKATNFLNYCATDSRPTQSDYFFITYRSIKLVKEDIEMVDGSGKKLSLRQFLNPNSIKIKIGGEVTSRKILISSKIDTTGETIDSKELFKKYKSTVVKMSKRVGSYYVLPNALQKLREGWRLTADIEYTLTMDLKE